MVQKGSDGTVKGNAVQLGKQSRVSAVDLPGLQMKCEGINLSLITFIYSVYINNINTKYCQR